MKLMLKAAGLTLTFLMMQLYGYSQFGRLSPADSLRRDSINRITQQDYKNMLLILDIDSRRHGPSGNPSDPNAANADESKASPYTTLPDPLTLKNGQK